MHDMLPGPLYHPTMQLPQSGALELDWYLPASHRVQLLLRLAGAYCPGTHAVHTSDRALEYLPARQSMHVSLDSVARWVPSGQGEQALWPGSLAMVPTGHCKHVVDPFVGAYLPLSQAVQSPAVALLYLPGKHGWGELDLGGQLDPEGHGY